MLSIIRSKMLRLLLLPGLSLLALMACGGNAAPSGPAQELSSPHPGLKVPTPTAVIFGGPHQGPIGDVPASVEEQIFTSRVIVRASLLSAAAKTETIPSGEGVAPTYRAVQELRFTAHEYLKGSGPSVAVVVVRSEHTYLTEAEAQRVADKSVSRRNTAWDGRQGALFLQPLYPSSTPAGAETAPGQASAPAFQFTVSNNGQSEWDYSIDTVSRSWLPAEETANATDQTSAAASVMFITDGAKLPHPTISLADLRSKIAASEAEIKAGAGIPGYLGCLRDRFIRERHFRKNPYVNPQLKATIDSGHAAGLELSRDEAPPQGSEYHNFWLSGPDKELFKASVVDNDDDPYNGYFYALSTDRPLPGDVYKVLYNIQLYNGFPCNFKPDDAYDEWTVTVTAPPGTLHEAFFDPAALTGGGVGFSGASGVLSPAGFSVGSAATTIQGLAWQNGSVSLTLQQYVSLDGYSLDFIGLDGRMTLTLDAGSATVDGAQGTLTWAAAEPPWHEGDMLMLRIRERE